MDIETDWQKQRKRNTTDKRTKSSGLFGTDGGAEIHSRPIVDTRLQVRHENIRISDQFQPIGGIPVQ